MASKITKYPVLESKIEIRKQHKKTMGKNKVKINIKKCPKTTSTINFNNKLQKSMSIIKGKKSTPIIKVKNQRKKSKSKNNIKKQRHKST